MAIFGRSAGLKRFAADTDLDISARAIAEHATSIVVSLRCAQIQILNTLTFCRSKPANDTCESYAQCSAGWRGPCGAAARRLDRLVYKPKQTVILPGDGDPCPECSMPTEIREHVAITDKLLAQHRYASRWFFVGTGDAAPSSFPNSLRSCGITAAAGYASVS